MKSLILAIVALCLIVSTSEAQIIGGARARAKTRQVRAVQRTERLRVLTGQGNQQQQRGLNANGNGCNVNRGAAAPARVQAGQQLVILQ